MIQDGTRDALQRTEALLNDMAPSSASPSIALMRASIEHVRDDLQSQLRTRVEVLLDGDPVTSAGSIRVDALSKVLGSLQEAVSAIGQALTGKATGSSSIPGPLRDRTAL